MRAKVLQDLQKTEVDQAATAPWEALIAVDQLARTLRIHRDRARNQEQILEKAFALIRAQALVWIPVQRDDPVLAQGHRVLSDEECRDLVGQLAQHPDLHAPAPLLCNRLENTCGQNFSEVENLVAFLVADKTPLGWLVAFNKEDGAAFCRDDAAILQPFAAFFELHLRTSSRYQDLKDLLVGLTRALTTALDAKDTYTYGHSERVARIALELAREMGLEEAELGDVYLTGLLHDIGNIGVKEAVLQKPGKLTDEEHEHVQQHVTIGYWILAELRQIRTLLPGVLHHHERVDGQGYPDGLEGEAIPVLARILAVADAYDAMSNQRPYRDALPYRRIEEILRNGAGKQWDANVVAAFLRCRHRIHTIRQRGVGDSLIQAIDGALRTGSSLAPSDPDMMIEERPARALMGNGRESRGHA